MTILSLKTVLNQAHPGEWLYQYDACHFKFTDGYWDKFCLCIFDIFTWFSTARSTQEAVQRALEDEIKSLKGRATTSPGLGQQKFFESAEAIRECQTFMQELSKCSLIWNRQLENLPTFESRDLASFDSQLNGMQEIYTVLPPQEELKYQDQITTLETALTQYNTSSAPEDTKIEAWLTLAQILNKCKKVWLAKPDDCKSYVLDDIPWRYNLGKWNIEPCRQIVQSANGVARNLFYLKVSFASVKMFGEWAAHYSTNPPNFTTWEKEQIQAQIDAVFQFVQGQVEHQRRPITLQFPNWVNALDGDGVQLVAARFKTFMDSLVASTQVLMKKNPTCFIHEAALLAEASPQTDASGCSSRLVYVYSNEDFIRPPVLRPELEPLVLQLKGKIDTSISMELMKCGASHDFTIRLCGRDRGCCKEVLLEAFPFLKTREDLKDPNFLNLDLLLQIDIPTSVVKMQQLEMELMKFEKSHDFTIRLGGKDRGCCKAVLLEAFPFLKTREELKGRLQGADPNLLNLDLLVQSVEGSVHPEFAEWVLDSILVFAYSRQRPALHRGSTNANNAFVSCCALLNYLRPDSFAVAL
jgi:hypothetical protein